MSKRISLICALTGLAAVGRIPFAAIPSVQLTTFFVLISGQVFGPRIGLTVGILSACCSNMLLGQGPWTIYQAIAWGLAGFSAGILGLFLSRQAISGKFFRLAGIGHAFLWGFGFGWITNLWHFYAFVYPHNWHTWMAVCLTSLPFDAAHAFTNLVAFTVLGPGVVAILNRYQQKLKVLMM